VENYGPASHQPLDDGRDRYDVLIKFLILRSKRVARRRQFLSQQNIRAIQHSQESLRALARRYGINQKTVAKWKKRRLASQGPGTRKLPAKSWTRYWRLTTRARSGGTVPALKPDGPPATMNAPQW
jgi:transposase-like protein